MKFAISHPISISVAMVVSLGMAWAMIPHTMLANQRGQIDLNIIVPKQFADWHAGKSTTQIVNPELTATLHKIYTQTLARVYVNEKGQMIMLSIAYGRDQNRGLQVHLPQYCYRGQGFAVDNVTQNRMSTPFGTIPVSRMVATLGSRVEPVTYWVVIGHTATDTEWTMRKAELRYAVRGVIPDGLLVRISSITSNVQRAYALERQFTGAMLAAIPTSDRRRFLGKQRN